MFSSNLPAWSNANTNSRPRSAVSTVSRSAPRASSTYSSNKTIWCLGGVGLPKTSSTTIGDQRNYISGRLDGSPVGTESEVGSLAPR